MSLPIVINENAVSITSNSAVLKGQLVSDGGLTTTVTLFYGLTDGGTTAGAWDHSLGVGTPTVGVDYLMSAFGLLPSRVYYYTSRATNSDGDAWSDVGSAGSKSFYLGTLGIPAPVAEVLTAARLEGHYRDNWVTSPDTEAQKGNVKWSSPIVPDSFQIAFGGGISGQVVADNVLTCYRCEDAALTFDYNKTGTGAFHFDQTWSSSGRTSYSPNNQLYNPYVTGKGVRVSLTPLYQGELAAAESWMLTRGVWTIDIDTYINPVLPKSDGVNYRLRVSAAPRRVDGVEIEFFNDIISSGDDSRTVIADLRADKFWNVFITLGGNARDGSVPNSTHLCTINASATLAT